MLKELWEKKKRNNEYVLIPEGCKLDKWQMELLLYAGNCILRIGRQSGKSVGVAIKVDDFAIMHPGTTSLVIAASQRQASLLFEKIRLELDDIEAEKLEIIKKSEIYKNLKTKREISEYERYCSIYKEIPTKTKIELKNGSKIYCLPAGKSGIFIRGYTIDLLIADEAPYIMEAVWVAIRPMLAVAIKRSNFGWQVLLGTPFGKGGYFFECSHDKDFRQWHISSEKCERIDKKFLRKERQKLTKLQYAQEYLAEFVDEFHQLFPTKLCKDRMTFMSWEFKDDFKRTEKYYLGVDIARYGEDENAFVISELNERGEVKIVKTITSDRKSLTDTAGRVLSLDENYHFRKIFTDDTGVGAGVTDMLIEKLGKNKVFGINNATRNTEFDKKRGIMKEDLYSNAIKLMEEKKIEIINNLKLLKSLKSVTFSYTLDKRLSIHGKYDHLAEAFVRACWCTKAKGLKLFIA